MELNETQQEAFSQFMQAFSSQESNDTESSDTRTRWRGVLTVLGTQAGDLDPRLLKSATWAELPMTLYAQEVNEPGHMGAQIAGNIDKVWIDGNLVMAAGFFSDNELGSEIARKVKGGELQGISADIRDGKVDVVELEDGAYQAIWDPAHIGAATLVGLPAFENARIEIDEVDSRSVASVGLGSVGPIKYNDAHFTKLNFKQSTRLEIKDDGEIFGHVVTWGKRHRGQGHETWTAKPSGFSDMPDFNIGTTHLKSGKAIATGVLTSEGLHAQDHKYSWDKATISRFVQGYRDKMMDYAYMEDVNMQFAQVVAWEDEFGVAVHGSLQPWVTPEQATRALAGCTSIDTRYGAVSGVHFVNICGFIPPPLSVTDSHGEIARMVASVASNVASSSGDCEECAKNNEGEDGSDQAGTSRIVDLKAVEQLDKAFAKAEFTHILAKVKSKG